RMPAGFAKLFKTEYDWDFTTAKQGEMSGRELTIEVALRRPGVILEVCGSFNSGADISRMVREVGADRVVYGSDFPFIDLRMSLGRVIFSDLAEQDRAAVLGGTMSRLLRWRSGVG
ncbi:amidohydrolase family protein, partial [Nonomuraea fuscirosea]